MGEIMRAAQQRAGARQDQQTIDRRRREEGAPDESQADQCSRPEPNQPQVERDVDPRGTPERPAVDDGNSVGVGRDPLTVTLDCSTTCQKPSRLRSTGSPFASEHSVPPRMRSISALSMIRPGLRPPLPARTERTHADALPLIR
jgi:hypothetical protein